jgi:hypothetical protein
MLWWWRGGSWAQAPFYHKLGSKLGHTSYSMIELFGLLIYEMIKSECLELWLSKTTKSCWGLIELMHTQSLAECLAQSENSAVCHCSFLHEWASVAWGGGGVTEEMHFPRVLGQGRLRSSEDSWCIQTVEGPDINIPGGFSAWKLGIPDTWPSRRLRMSPSSNRRGCWHHRYTDFPCLTGQYCYPLPGLLFTKSHD